MVCGPRSFPLQGMSSTTSSVPLNLFRRIDVGETANLRARAARVIPECLLVRTDLETPVGGLLANLHIGDDRRVAGIHLIAEEAAERRNRIGLNGPLDGLGGCGTRQQCQP